MCPCVYKPLALCYVHTHSVSLGERKRVETLGCCAVVSVVVVVVHSTASREASARERASEREGMTSAAQVVYIYIFRPTLSLPLYYGAKAGHTYIYTRGYVYARETPPLCTRDAVFLYAKPDKARERGWPLKERKRRARNIGSQNS